MNALLKNLQASETLSELSMVVASPRALRSALLQSNEVAEMRRALREGSLTEDGISELVSAAMRKLQPGVRLEDDILLAAVAVATESLSGEFFDDFINDLSSLQLAEMRASTDVAAICRKARMQLSMDHRSSVLRADIPYEGIELEREDEKTIASFTDHYTIMDYADAHP